MTHVTACAVVVVARRREMNQVLLGKRKKEEGFGLWSLPGGKMDEGETPNQAVRREALEEVNLQLVDPLPVYFEFNKEDPNYQYLMLYWIDYIDDTKHDIKIKADHEFSELRWFDMECLPEEMWASDRRAIQRAVEYNYDHIGSNLP